MLSSRLNKGVFRYLREWVCRVRCFCRWFCFVARELYDLVRHVSAEVGVATTPLFVPRLVVGEEKAIDHRVGSSRSEGASQRWASWEAGFVPGGCVQNLPLTCVTPARVRNRWIVGMTPRVHVLYVLRPLVSQPGVTSGGGLAVPQVTEASRTWRSRRRRISRGANGVADPHCECSSLYQWWQMRTARRVRSGPVVWDGRGGAGRLSCFTLL